MGWLIGYIVGGVITFIAMFALAYETTKDSPYEESLHPFFILLNSVIWPFFWLWIIIQLIWGDI